MSQAIGFVGLPIAVNSLQHEQVSARNNLHIWLHIQRLTCEF